MNGISGANAGGTNPALANGGGLSLAERAGAAAGIAGGAAVAEAFAQLSPVEQGRALAALDAQTGDPLASNAAVDPEAHTCTVEVRYTPVALGANHAFIVTTDANSQNYFRGGPAANGGGLNSSSGSGTVPTAERVDPNHGIYGHIVTEYGAYRPGTIDWTTEPTGQQTVDQFAGNCDAVEASLAQTMDDIEAARINYMPLGQNSNSTVREGLERAGYPNVDPVVWAPAWNAQLNTN